MTTLEVATQRIQPQTGTAFRLKQGSVLRVRFDAPVQIQATR